MRAQCTLWENSGGPGRLRRESRQFHHAYVLNAVRSPVDGNISAELCVKHIGRGVCMLATHFYSIRPERCHVCC